MSDYTAVITGASKGIGRDLAERMLEKGYRVISISRNLPDDPPEGMISYQADLLDEGDCNRVAQEIAEKYAVTHFVHNAGLIWPNLLEDAKPSDISGLAQLHLGAALTLLQAFLPAMKKRQFGRVIFNGSRAALGVPTRTAYAATKAAIIGMARTWALELAPHGVTVNIVAPGPVKTDNFWGIIPKGSQRESDLAKKIPVGRLGDVGDISKAFLYFADPENGFVTGQTLYVCGGASIGTITL